MLFKDIYSKSIHKIDSDEAGRNSIIHLNMNETAYKFLSIYAPNLEEQIHQKVFWHHIHQKLSEKEDRQIVIGPRFSHLLCLCFITSTDNVDCFRYMRNQ